MPLVCGRCGSAAGARNPITGGDPQQRGYFACSNCGAITSPVSCMKRTRKGDHCGGPALSWCLDCREAVCGQHRAPQKRESAPPYCKACVKRASERRLVAREAPQREPWWARA